MAKRRRFTAVFKARVVLQALRRDKTDLTPEHTLTSQTG